MLCLNSLAIYGPLIARINKKKRKENKKRNINNNEENRNSNYNNIIVDRFRRTSNRQISTDWQLVCCFSCDLYKHVTAVYVCILFPDVFIHTYSTYGGIYIMAFYLTVIGTKTEPVLLVKM